MQSEILQLEIEWFKKTFNLSLTYVTMNDTIKRKWQIRFSHSAKKQYQRLERSGKSSILDLVDLLVQDLERGPKKTNWPNFGKLSDNVYHCHLKKGRPTYVACWVVINEKLKEIEIFYVGTHENAPY